MATFSIVGDDAAMQAVFVPVADTITAVTCPGKIASPGPWRRQAAQDRINGTLLCGYHDGAPSIAWTTNDRLLVSAIQADARDSTLEGLFAW